MYHPKNCDKNISRNLMVGFHDSFSFQKLLMKLLQVGDPFSQKKRFGKKLDQRPASIPSEWMGFCWYMVNHKKTGWWQLKYFLCSSLFGEDSHFDDHIFQRGWNHPRKNVLGLNLVIHFMDRLLYLEKWNNQHPTQHSRGSLFKLSRE